MSEKRSKLLGPDHPDTLSSLANLACCYREIGKIEKAIAIQEDVSEKRSKLLGPDHPKTLSSLERLAGCYREIGKIEKAIAIREEKQSKLVAPDPPRRNSLCVLL